MAEARSDTDHQERPQKSDQSMTVRLPCGVVNKVDKDFQDANQNLTYLLRIRGVAINVFGRLRISAKS